MGVSEAVTDLRLWIAASLALSLSIPRLDIPSSDLIVIALMVQMTLSMDGLKLSLSNLRDNRKGAALSILLCYVLNTSVTLAAGLLFMGSNDDIWYGWVMLASMPCAIAVVTAAVLMSCSVESAVVAVSATYLSGLALTPVLSFALIGDAVNPLEILRYILLFIAVPVLLSRPLGLLHLKKGAKVVVINMMMGAMVFLSVNSNADFIMGSPGLVATVLGVVVARVLLLHAIMRIVTTRMDLPEDSRGIFLVLGVWKNTGLSVSMSMILLASASSAIPCFLSLIVETMWFSIVTRRRRIPAEAAGTETAPSQ